jgi:uncharacterized protein YceK
LLIFFITNQVIADNASKQDGPNQDASALVVKATEQAKATQQASAIGLRMPFSSVTV